MISFPWKDVAGREDRTRDRRHIRQMRIWSSCHARLRPSKNSLYLSCIIPRALFKPFKQMGWKWRYSEGNHQAINKQNYFFFSNKSSCECFLIYCLCQSLLWAKDEICKDYFRGFLGAKPPRSQIIFIFDSAPHYLHVIRVFRLCQYVLQFTADNVEYFRRYMPNSRRFLWKKNIYIFPHILVGFYPSKSVKDFSWLLLTICKRQFFRQQSFFFQQSR